MTITVCSPVDIVLPMPSATDRLGATLADMVQPGDTVLLAGEIGVGKSHLARHLIQTLMPKWGAAVEDVPSPTYTLIQTYATPRAEIWHADLYRLTGPDEIEELGLLEAMDTELCLVEWPDRLGHLTPENALTITLAHRDDGRMARLDASASRWAPLLASLPASL